MTELAPPSPKVLLIGTSGMLGRDVEAELVSRGWTFRNPLHEDFDVLNMQHLETLRKWDGLAFDWVVNCAAFTQVDRAESEPMAAMRLNGMAPGLIGAVCAEKGWRLLQLSTDFVFDGQKAAPYVEDDPVAPLNVYGKSKLLGEQNALKECPNGVVVRTSWLYGVNGNSFPKTILKAWSDGKDLRVVDDQTGCPTATTDLAKTLCDLMLANPASGVYHACGPQSMTWHGLAVAAVEAYKQVTGDQRPIEIAPVSTKDWPTPAARPAYSVLDCGRLAALGIQATRETKESLAEFCQRLVEVTSA